MLPIELRYQRRWVRWRYDENGKKSPYAGWGKTGAPMTFDEARDGGRHMVGILLGYEPRTGHGPKLAGLDLDDCLGAGEALPWAQEALKWFPSYTEISPSGTGLKIITLGGPDYLSPNKMSMGDGRRAIEVYVSGRFFAFTGREWSGGHANLLTECPAGWDWLIAKFGATTVRERTGQAPEFTVEPDALEEMLRHIPVAEYRDDYKWWGLMASCHHATDGWGEDVWIAWSVADDPFKDHAEMIRARWKSLGTDRGVGWRPLVAALRRAGVAHLAPLEVREGSEKEWPDDE